MRERLVSIGLALAVAALVLPLAGALGTRAGLWRFTAGFALIAAGVLAAVTAVVLAAVGGWLTARWGLAGASIACGLVALAVPVAVVAAGRGPPPNHDITTDPSTPPAGVAALPLRPDNASPAAYDGPAAAAAQQRAYPDVQPIVLAISPYEALRRAVAAARALGWTIVGQDPGRGTIEATDTTFWFGFTDDIVIRVSRAGEGSRVDIRSKSRVGVGDLGVNAQRIRRFTAEMRK